MFGISIYGNRAGIFSNMNRSTTNWWSNTGSPHMPSTMPNDVIMPQSIRQQPRLNITNFDFDKNINSNKPVQNNHRTSNRLYNRGTWSKQNGRCSSC